MHHQLHPTLLFLVSACAVAAADGDIVFKETFEDPAMVAFVGAPAPVADGTGKVLRISQSDASKVISYRKELDLKQIAGKALTFSARIKGEGISDKPQSFNGVKLLMVVVRADDTVIYKLPTLPTGTWDWTTGSGSVHIPADAKKVQLVLGLEKVSGIAWFDDVTVTLGEKP